VLTALIAMIAVGSAASFAIRLRRQPAMRPLRLLALQVRRQPQRNFRRSRLQPASAKKRPSRVGLTIAALSGDALEKANVSSVEDLTRLVPGLTYTRSAYSTPVYTLRGVGFYDTSLGASPAVSVYIDQIPLAYPALTSHGVGLDMERLEVLKGPQGILFGENSTGVRSITSQTSQRPNRNPAWMLAMGDSIQLTDLYI